LAQFNLGLIYEHGQGVLQNKFKAHMWYNIASASGFSRAGDCRVERAGLMSSADIPEVHSVARECMISSYKKFGY
jgi:TPR repeat protein